MNRCSTDVCFRTDVPSEAVPRGKQMRKHFEIFRIYGGFRWLVDDKFSSERNRFFRWTFSLCCCQIVNLTVRSVSLWCGSVLAASPRIAFHSRRNSRFIPAQNGLPHWQESLGGDFGPFDTKSPLSPGFYCSVMRLARRRIKILRTLLGCLR